MREKTTAVARFRYDGDFIIIHHYRNRISDRTGLTFHDF